MSGLWSRGAWLAAALCVAGTAEARPSKGAEAAVRSSPGPLCRLYQSTFLVRVSDDEVAPVPTVDDSFATPIEVGGPECWATVSFTDGTRTLDVQLGDAGTTRTAVGLEGPKSRKTFKPIGRWVSLRGRFGGTSPWSDEIRESELAAVGIPRDPPGVLDLSSATPVFLRVRRCVGTTCDAYYHVNAEAEDELDPSEAEAATCTQGMEVRLVDGTLRITEPTVQRCVPDSDGVISALFPAAVLRRAQTLRIALPGYDLPELLLPMPTAQAQVLMLDVRIQQDE